MAFYVKDEIKNRVDIIDLARRHYGVDFAQDNGNTAKCCCPFHGEKTPSCVFTGLGNDDRSSRFHCFGCGADGDVIDFVMKSDNITLTEACEKLISLYNLDRSVVCAGTKNGKKLSKSEVATNKATNNLKVTVKAIKDLQDSYSRGEITCDDYDIKLAPLMKMYEENLSKAYRNKTIGNNERDAFLTAFKSRIPKWLDQKSPVYRGGMVIKGKDMPLYTRKGTKLCDKFSNIIVSPGEKGMFGAFVEIEPCSDIVLQDKDIHPDDVWKTEKKEDGTPKYKVFNIRYTAPDYSGCTIVVQKNPIFTGEKKIVTVNGKTEEKSLPPIFQKDKWYVDVHDVLDIKSLQRLLPDRFPSIKLPDYLDHPCFKPNMCIAYKVKGQDVVCKYKLVLNDENVYIDISTWSCDTISKCVDAAKNNVELLEDKLFETATVKIVELNSKDFEKYCGQMKSWADKSPVILNTDDESVNFIARLSGRNIGDRVEGRN